MSTPSWMSGPPKKILLATDLSPRCDRALDRAAALAAQWQATLVVLHVLEDRKSGISSDDESLPSWRRPPDPLSVAKRQLVADIGAVAEKAIIVIEEGDPVEAILRTVETEGCDLIVTGVARNELLGRIMLGRTVDRLLRTSRTPVLVVKQRMRETYRDIVVATDFSESSRHALEAAARFFPDHKLTVFHAYEAPRAGATEDAASYRRTYGKIAAQDCEAFLRSVDIPEGWQAPHVLIEHGQPSHLLHDYVQDKDMDLVVLGTHGHSALFEIFLGSVAKQIMDRLPCDALIVREPRAAVER